MRGKFIVVEGLEGAGKSSVIGLIVQALEDAGKRVEQTREPGGTPMAEAMMLAGGFPPLVTGVVTLGEESGKLPFLLNKIADLYEEDFETNLQTLTTFIEPVLLGVMGLVIGFIVLGTFLPMINLVQQL